MQVVEEFTQIIPSNGETLGNEENSSSSFQITLNKQMYFNQPEEWEVALEELFIPGKFYNVYEPFNRNVLEIRRVPLRDCEAWTYDFEKYLKSCGGIDQTELICEMSVEPGFYTPRLFCEAVNDKATRCGFGHFTRTLYRAQQKQMNTVRNEITELEKKQPPELSHQQREINNVEKRALARKLWETWEKTQQEKRLLPIVREHKEKSQKKKDLLMPPSLSAANEEVTRAPYWMDHPHLEEKTISTGEPSAKKARVVPSYNYQTRTFDQEKTVIRMMPYAKEGEGNLGGEDTLFKTHTHFEGPYTAAAAASGQTGWAADAQTERGLKFLNPPTLNIESDFGEEGGENEQKISQPPFVLMRMKPQTHKIRMNLPPSVFIVCRNPRMQKLLGWARFDTVIPTSGNVAMEKGGAQIASGENVGIIYGNNMLGKECQILLPETCDFGRNNRIVFIYTNMVKDNHVGNTQCPMLRMVDLNVDDMARKSVHHQTFSQRQYRPIKGKRFDVMKFQLLNGLGENFPFQHGEQTLVVLHYRRIKKVR